MPRHTVIPSRVLIVISTVVVALVLLLASSVQATSGESLADDGSNRNGTAAEYTAAGYTAAGYTAAGYTAAEDAVAEYKVRAGDSLWGIADEHTPDGYDVRNTIEAIKSINGLGSSVIHPGQVLEIPLLSSS